jgi:hypothetical protein
MFPVAAQTSKQLDPSTLRSLAEDLRTACAQARAKPEQFAQIFEFLVRAARIESSGLDDANSDWLAERASELDVPPALRRDLVEAAAELETRRLLSTLVKDAAQDEESRDWLRRRTETKKPPEHLVEELLRCEVPAVRELGARAAICWEVLLTVASAVLVYDANEEALDGLVSTAGRDSRLREAIALIAVCRSTSATAASTVAPLEAIGRSPCWLHSDPRADPVLRVDGHWPGCDDLARMPGRHELLTKTLDILFLAKRADLAVPILLEVPERAIADLLRDEVKGWQSSPELVTLLVQGRPEFDPGIVADLCGLFLRLPAQPRNHLSSRPYAPWRLLDMDDTLAGMLRAFVSGLLDSLPRVADAFDLTYWRVPNRRLDELIERFRTSPAGKVAGKLATLEDRGAARAAFLAWFASYASPADWDGIFAFHASPIRRLDVLWPRLSTEVAADIVAAAFADDGLMVSFPERPDWSRILTSIARSSREAPVRADALALKIRAGEDVPEVEDPAVLTGALRRLTKERMFHPGAVPLLSRLFKTSDEVLLADLPELSAVLAPALDHAHRVRDVAGPSGVERLTRLRKRLVAAVAMIPVDEARSILRRSPGPLAETVAASIKMPRALRLAATFVALEAPDFDPRRCDISDDVELIVDSFAEMRRAHSSRMETARQHLVRVALNALVREPPRHEDFDEQSMPHFRLREALRETLNAFPEAVAFAVEHLTASLSRSLRDFLSRGLPLQDKDRAVAWLRAIGKLRDPRVTAVLEGNILSLANAGLGLIADQALRDATLADDLSDGSRVVLAIRSLRRDSQAPSASPPQASWTPP